MQWAGAAAAAAVLAATSLTCASHAPVLMRAVQSCSTHNTPVQRLRPAGGGLPRALPASRQARLTVAPRARRAAQQGGRRAARSALCPGRLPATCRRTLQIRGRHRYQRGHNVVATAASRPKRGGGCVGDRGDHGRCCGSGALPGCNWPCATVLAVPHNACTACLSWACHFTTYGGA